MTLEMPTMTRRTDAPALVRIFHSRAGQEHVFTSPDIPGLFLGNADIRAAFDLVPDAVESLVLACHGVAVSYKPEMSFEEFQTRIDSNELMVPLILQRQAELASY